jgi:hypothetical protein
MVIVDIWTFVTIKLIGGVFKLAWFLLKTAWWLVVLLITSVAFADMINSWPGSLRVVEAAIDADHAGSAYVADTSNYATLPAGRARSPRTRAVNKQGESHEKAHRRCTHRGWCDSSHDHGSASSSSSSDVTTDALRLWQQGPIRRGDRYRGQ